jgi:inner membrane transporter RhtA
MPFDGRARRPARAVKVDARAVTGQAGLGGARPTAVAMVLTAATSIQFGAAFAVTLFDALGAGGATLLRLAWAALILTALWRPRLRGQPAGALTTAVQFGLALGLMNWSFYEAIARIPLGVAVTLEFIGPLGVAVVGSRRPRDLLWVILAAAGIVLLGDAGTGSRLDPWGVAFALAAGACWAAYIVLSARTGAALPGGRGLAIAMVVATAVALPAGVLQAGSRLVDPPLLAAGLVVALASSVIPYSLELEVLRRLPAAVFGVLMSLEPALAALAGFLVLGQGLVWTEVMAIGLVVLASAGAASTARTPPAHEP